MRFAVRYREDAPVRVAVGALVLLALAIGLTYFFHTADAGRFGFGTALAWALAMLGLAVLFIAVLLMRESRPTVRLGLDGLLDRRWSAKPIGWSNIAEFDPVHWFGIPAVRLRLVDPDLDPPASLFARLARAIGLVAHDDVLVLVLGLDCTADVLATRILGIGTAAIEAAEEAEAWAAGSEYAAPPHG
ncbi:MAG: hypothetical protein B7Y35_02780 [Sphingomonadales bacterium 28-64-96]|nr:MAG: hypothetical protein B7Y35_02780 [Sphingomonadales bacterium 28-64-96]